MLTTANAWKFAVRSVCEYSEAYWTHLGCDDWWWSDCADSRSDLSCFVTLYPDHGVWSCSRALAAGAGLQCHCRGWQQMVTSVTGRGGDHWLAGDCCLITNSSWVRNCKWTATADYYSSQAAGRAARHNTYGTAAQRSCAAHAHCRRDSWPSVACVVNSNIVLQLPTPSPKCHHTLHNVDCW